MASKQASWRSITKKPLSDKEFHNLLAGLLALPDQALALVGAALLERQLESAIALRLVRLKTPWRKEVFDGTGPLASFSSKIRMGFALGAYGRETISDLDKIRQIRNVFAHSIHPVRFSSKRISRFARGLKACDRSKIPAVFFMLKLATFDEIKKHIENPKLISLPKLKSARQRFIYSVMLYWFCLCSEVPPRPTRRRDKHARTYLR